MAVIAIVPPAQLAFWSQALCDFELKKFKLGMVGGCLSALVGGLFFFEFAHD